MVYARVWLVICLHLLCEPKLSVQAQAPASDDVSTGIPLCFIRSMLLIHNNLYVYVLAYL